MPDTAPLCVVLRADATPQIGVGHVMRCLALAEANIERGGRSVVLGACESDTLQERIRRTGAEFVSLAPDPDLHAHAAATRATVSGIASSETRPVWLVIDGYGFDSGYHAAAAADGVRRMLIVDSAVPVGEHIDVLLNQNVGAAALEYPGAESAVPLLGPSYALLRREIRTGRRSAVSARMPRVLITMGGADAADASSRMLSALSLIESRIQVRVVVGAMNPRAGALRALAASLPFPVEIVATPADVAQHMTWADVAIAAAGSTAYELASLGTVLILVITAANQVPVAEGLAKEGAALSLGPLQHLTDDAVRRAVMSVLEDDDLRRCMGTRAQLIVDGNGCARVLNVLTALSTSDLKDRLVVRPATAADARALLRLANDPSVRARSFNPEPIGLEEHVRWLDRKLSSPHTRVLVADLEGVLVAQIRYDRTQDGLEISIAVSSALRGRGIATALLDRTCVAAAASLGVNRVYGLVMDDNPASLRAFRNAGFSPASRTVRGGRECIVVERITGVGVTD